MDIEISSPKRQPVTRKIRNGALARAGRLFERLGHLVRRLEVRIDDVNGPKGGVCKRALAVVRLVDGGQLTVEHRHQAVSGAIGQVLQRTRDLLARNLDRNRELARVTATGRVIR